MSKSKVKKFLEKKYKDKVLIFFKNIGIHYLLAICVLILIVYLDNTDTIKANKILGINLYGFIMSTISVFYLFRYKSSDKKIDDLPGNKEYKRWIRLIREIIWSFLLILLSFFILSVFTRDKNYYDFIYLIILIRFLTKMMMIFLGLTPLQFIIFIGVSVLVSRVIGVFNIKWWAFISSCLLLWNYINSKDFLTLINKGETVEKVPQKLELRWQKNKIYAYFTTIITYLTFIVSSFWEKDTMDILEKATVRIYVFGIITFVIIIFYGLCQFTFDKLKSNKNKLLGIFLNKIGITKYVNQFINYVNLHKEVLSNNIKTKGELKMKELSPKYNPAEVEAGRYAKWLEADVFAPSGDAEAKPYSIVIPPPNVTGKLHLGHAWDTTLQDIIIRQKRMQGFDTLWLPGMDHAGIATQAKVEERLREQGVTRYYLGREKFLDKVWEWKDEYAATIREQWGKLGLSLDYQRDRFTLDEGLSKAVRKVFVELYKKGWIYRGEFIINWDPAARTALSDIEVIHKDVEGAFYHMNYMLEDGSRALQVATTRPETMFGDVAVAVNPEDPRYKDLIGKNVILPIVNKLIPIVADEHADPEFGTGVVKITPAHDPNDFLVGQRHNLPQVNVMNDDGTMNELAGEFAGMDRFEARKATVDKLQELGALVKIENRVHSVGHSERTGVMVEPRLSNQWFVKMDELAKNAIANQATEDRVDFYPTRFNDTFLQWMENVHDWVISRQLWWGHQIPAWYNESGEMYVGEEAPAGDGWVQDEDVLDTWFSSALWPFSTMGWPDENAADFQRYFPTSTLVTGYDIIFFWVSRMIFQSLEFTGRQPFKNVLIHGLIRDEEGRKMSKSLGNGIDPMDVIEKYGADALRWFLSNGSAPGQDVRFSYEKMDASWNFINKIWNISRYILMNNEGLTLDAARENVAKVAAGEAGNVTDRWILHNLNETIVKVTENFDKFEFGVAGHILYNFIWEEFANWYVELTKEVLYSDNETEKVMTRSVLLYTLDQILRLLHPIMPFVTEEIFAQYAEGSIVTAAYPVVNPAFENAEAHKGVESLKDLIRSVRNARSEVNVAPSKPITILIKTADAELETFFKANENYIRRFTNPEQLEISSSIAAPELAMSAVITGAEIFLPLADLLNVEEELARLDKELSKWQKELDMVGKKLSNERFIANAKPEVVEKEKEKQADYQAKYDATVGRIEEMKKLV